VRATEEGKLGLYRLERRPSGLMGGIADAKREESDVIGKEVTPF